MSAVVGDVSLRRLPVVVRSLVPNAPLPVNYQAAKKALRECEEIDEVKDWSDRATAIASYARQVRDMSMLHTAQRIQLRARERLGEMLLQWPRGKKSTRFRRGHPGVRSAARKQGISEGLIAQALDIASVDADIRNQRIEATPPISATALAKLSPRVHARYGLGSPDEVSMRRFDLLDQIWHRFNKLGDATDLARKVVDEYADGIRAKVVQMQEWLDTFEQALPKSK
jgi:predicted GNAT family acetyltransferase